MSKQPDIYTALKFLNTIAKLVDMPKQSKIYTVFFVVLEIVANLRWNKFTKKPAIYTVLSLLFKKCNAGIHAPNTWHIYNR